MSVISTPSVASLLVHPVSGGQFAGAVLAVVTDSSPETGASWTEEEALNVLLCPSEGSNSHCDARTLSQSDRGVDKTDFRFPFSPFRLSHATCRAECGGNCRKDSDYDVEDLAPSAVVVECSHSGKIG